MSPTPADRPAYEYDNQGALVSLLVGPCITSALYRLRRIADACQQIEHARHAGDTHWHLGLVTASTAMLADLRRVTQLIEIGRDEATRVTAPPPGKPST